MSEAPQAAEPAAPPSARAVSLARSLCWLSPVGVAPVASDGFGPHRPSAARLLALGISGLSVWCWLYAWTAPEVCRDLKLWIGTPAIEATQHAAAHRAAPPDSRLAEARRIIEDMLKPEQPGEFRWQALLTHPFIEPGLVALVGNVLFLLAFGSAVNARLGSARLLGLFPLLAIAAALAEWAATAGEPGHPLCGSSGAVMGLAGIYFGLFGARNMQAAAWWRPGLIFGRVHVREFALPATWMLAGYIAFEILLIDGTAGIGAWGQLGGFAAGLLAGYTLATTRTSNADEQLATACTR